MVFNKFPLNCMESNNTNIYYEQHDKILTKQNLRVAHVIISGENYTKIQALCQNSKLSVSALIQYAFHKVLSIYKNQSQTQICNFDATILKFQNIIVIHEDSLMSCIECVQSVQGQIEINTAIEGSCDGTGILFQFSTDRCQNETSRKLQFKIMLTAIEYLDTLNINLFWYPDRCVERQLEDWLDVLTTVTKNIITHPTQPILTLSCIPQNQVEKFRKWNEDTDGEFQNTKRLDELIEEATCDTPDKIAITFNETRLSYKELNERANQLANYFLNIGTGELVALVLDNSEVMVITILALWKSGAAWVPIDPSFPDERIKFILNDTGVKIVVTTQKYGIKLLHILDSAPNIQIFYVDSTQTEVSKLSSKKINLQLNSKNLAYLLYTSGTTGVPKGVAKEHRGVVNCITDLSSKYEMDKSNEENVALFSSYVFEPFVRQLLISLINSHNLVIVPNELKADVNGFESFLIHQNITYLNGTPSVLEQYNYSKCTNLKKILLVGEELTTRKFEKLRASFNGTIISEYGFTEAALVSTMKKFEPSVMRVDGSVGRPLRNVKCYILDGSKQRVPTGAIGEIYIGGQGVACGYFNRPELTAERFHPNPFQTPVEAFTNDNSVIYKTGDLGRWIPNGEIEYLGRNDFQIKLHGIRIELGEIESIVLTYPGIDKCIVIGKTSEKNLSDHMMGYFVSKNGQIIPESELYEYLESKLPLYMIPRRLVQLKKIPVNLSGKVDWQALPNPVEERQIRLKPRNEFDKILVEIWKDILCIQDIDISADFFRCGGNSITSIQLISRIRKHAGVSIGIDTIFSTRTIKNLSDFLTSAKLDSSLHVDTCAFTQRHSQADRYLASGLQQGLLYHYLKQKDDDAYIVQNLYKYGANLNKEKYKKAWEIALHVYPALRLRFPSESEMVQVISEKEELCWYYYDLKSADTGITIQDIIRSDRETRYNLEAGKLFRIHLIKENEEEYSLLFSCHHIILDGWSIPILTSFTHDVYLRLTKDEEIDVATLRTDTTYGLVQEYLTEHRSDHSDYWKEEVNSISQRCNLESLLKEEKRYTERINDYDFVRESKEATIEISVEILQLLKDSYINQGLTLHSILQFVWHGVLHVYGQGAQTVVGTTVSGRNIPVDLVECSVGLYINTLPLVVHHDPRNLQARTLYKCIQEIQSKVNQMNDKSITSLGSIQHGEMKHSLFDSLFVLENYPVLDPETVAAQNELLGFKLEGEFEKLDYPLAVVVRENTSGLAFTLRYAGELFDTTRIASLLELVKSVLSQIAKVPSSTPFSSISFILPSELELFNAWNTVEEEFPETTISKVIETMAAKFPKNLAVVYEQVKITYDEMNRSCNSFARHILQLSHLNPNDVIGLLLDKNEQMITSILSVWKTGAAFVPIDASYPDERIKFILTDTKASIVITNSRYAKRLKLLLPNIIVIPVEIALKKIANLDPSNLGTRCSNSNLAYVIYTSGTTGTPKGVMIEHRGVVNLMTSLYKLFGLRKTPEVILSFSNYVFDHFYEQMLDALFNGQTLVVLNDEMRTDETRLKKYIAQNNVTYLSGTPSVLSMYNYAGLPNLKRIDGVGEDFTSVLYQKIRSSFNGLIINGYGPTEISITSHKKLYPMGSMRINKSIGTQIHNTATYVLDSELNRVPIGAVGEMYIGGVGVARGYLNRPDLSSDRFISNPFSSHQNNLRMYKTGDLVRLLDNGEVEYLGRNDSQVKIRGQRIEVSEIEAVMVSHPSVEHSVVVLEEGKRFLVGYYVLGKQSTLDEASLKYFISPKLPTYMVPARLVQIEAVPVTISGKVDTKRLPKVELISSTNKSLPSNEIEEKLCWIWSELLNQLEIGTRDDFMSLGGDSLLAVTLSFMVSKALGRTLTVSDVFRLRTVENMAHHITNITGMVETNGILRSNASKADLSLAQERILFIHELEGGSNAFNITINLKISHKVAPSIIKEAVAELIRRHEVLRTVYPVNGAKRVQVVLPIETILKELEIAQCGLVKDLAELNAELFKISQHFFELETELPVKFLLAKCSNDDDYYYISFTFHHICFDEWSHNIFCKELKTLINNPGLQLPELPITYLDFAMWQREKINSCPSTIGTYWKKKLENVEPLQIITDAPRPSKFDYIGAMKYIMLPTELSIALKSVAKHMKVSFFSLLSSAFGLMLSVYTSQTEILVGTPVTSRNRSELEGLVGFFVNLVVLKLNVDPRKSVATYVKAVSEEVMQSTINSEISFDKIVKNLGLEQDLSRHPLFQVLFALAGEDEVQEDSSISQYNPDFEYTPAKYDLNVTVKVAKDSLLVSFNWATSLFSEVTIDRLMDSYSTLLRQFSNLEVLEQKVGEISLVDQTKIFSITANVNDNLDIAPQSHLETVLHAFEKSVQEFPDKIALVYQDVELTYADLNAKANTLAKIIESTRSTKPIALVALFVDKSDVMIVSILAIWKTGAAYVPIDPEAPHDRIKFMLEDTETVIVVTSAKYKNLVKDLCSDAIEIVVADSPINQNDSTQMDMPPVLTSGGSLAYIIYTSGTTGKPKGVMIEHRSLAKFRHFLHDKYFNSLGEEGVLFLSNYVFDFSIEQLLLSLFSGNKLIIPPANFSLDASFYSYCNQHGLTYLSGTPTFLHRMDLLKFDRLKLLTVAGEMFTRAHFEKIRKYYRGTINNAYGVTETTIYNMVDQFEGNEYRNSLGAALENTKVYILNKSMKALPDGAVGELYLAGSCVARGYLNRQLLTEESFLKNPFETDEEFSRMYKTGDLVRKNYINHIEYIGRKDKQIKIRGFRIELDEIGSILQSFPSISEVAIQAVEDNLIAYYVHGSTQPLNESTLTTYLKSKLPSYMIPSNFICLPELPITPNGKLDEKRLPQFQAAQRPAYVPPRNAIEDTLCKNIHALLGSPQGNAIGINDNFFYIGGDSILALLLVSQLQEPNMGVRINVRNIFELKTVRRIAEHIAAESLVPAKETLAEQGILTGTEYQLTPIQQWFFHKKLSNPHHWNQTFSIVTPVLEIDRLVSALQALYAHHDALRLRFKSLRPGSTQFYAPIENVNFRTVDVSKQINISQLLNKWQSSFDLQHGPTSVVVYLHGYDDGFARIWFAIHHLIVDTVSWRIICRNLETFYNDSDLTMVKTSSYREWVNSCANYQLHEEEKNYWGEILEEVGSFNDILMLQSSKPEKCSLELDIDTQNTAALLGNPYTPNELLLTAVNLSLQQAVTGKSVNYITLEGHGREESVSDTLNLTNTVGWFTSMYPVKLEVKSDTQASLLAVKKSLGGVRSNGVGYGIAFGYINNALPNISFNYLGQIDSSCNSSGWSIDSVQLDYTNNHCTDSTVSRRGVLDITAWCFKGQLTVHVESNIGENTLSKFMDSFKLKIQEVSACKNSSCNIERQNFEPYFLFSAIENPTTAGTIFILPPGEGGAESYFNNLLLILQHHHNVVLFNNKYLYEKKPTSFEELSVYYIRHVRKIQPKGPYNFVGWSFGGVLSFEMAHQLEQSGDEVSSIVMIDSYFNITKAYQETSQNGVDILDKINRIYNPSNRNIRSNNIVLFQAKLINDMYRTEGERIIYNYFLHTPSNNLDTIIDAKSFQIVPMLTDTHNSWVKNQKQVAEISEVIIKFLKNGRIQ